MYLLYLQPHIKCSRHIKFLFSKYLLSSPSTVGDCLPSPLGQIVFSQNGCNTISHPSCTSYSVTLILLPWGLGSVSPLPESGQALVTVSTKREWQKWFYMTSKADHKRQCSFHLVLQNNCAKVLSRLVSSPTILQPPSWGKAQLAYLESPCEEAWEPGRSHPVPAAVIIWLQLNERLQARTSNGVLPEFPTHRNHQRQ